MADHELEDDYERWPRDPFDLLGVSHGSSERDARLAYTRLIRRFKPELFPEHFRRIREAYDHVRARIAWHHYDPEADAEQVSDGEAGTSVFQTSRHASTGAHDTRQRPTSDPLDDAWRVACDGQLDVAYRRLVDSTARAHQPSRRYAMLYWLLATEPRLDPSRVPLDWLVTGLNELGYCDALGQLLHWELSLRPRQALAPSFDKLFPPGPTVMPLATLYRWRWAALAGREDNLQVLLADLKRATEHLDEYSPECTSTVIEGLRHLAWLKRHSDAGAKAFARYREMLQHIDVYHASGWELDRLELQEEVARECQAWSDQQDPPVLFLIAIEVYCRRGLRAARRPLLTWLRSLLQRPGDGLHFCAALAHTNQPLWAQIVQIVEETAPYDEPPEDEELPGLEPAVFTFFDRLPQDAPDVLRKSILLFCMREMVSPQTLSRVLARHGEDIRGTILQMAETIAGDRPLWLLYTAYRICAEPSPQRVIVAKSA